MKQIKSANERCIQETLNEYCNKLGLTDDQIVPNEHANYEDYNYARFDNAAQKWKCYANIVTGPGARNDFILNVNRKPYLQLDFFRHNDD